HDRHNNVSNKKLLLQLCAWQPQATGFFQEIWPFPGALYRGS
uniref:Uncharacterized protein n=1 Tax=Aegilops tauschii subsp. strangulata TaxID=200361 RepID=A0A453RSG0_AEGTS